MRKRDMPAALVEGDEGGEEYGERESHWDEGLCYVEEELEVYVEGESLAYKVVNVFPQKLHHDDEEADAECACKQRQVVAQYEKVESLDEFQTVWKC